jgi:outer membrane receptor for Fe3+-dicitrate
MNAFMVKNLPEYDGVKPKRVYQAVQLVFNKRYSNRWQGLFSVVYSWSEGFAARTMRQADNMEGPMVTDDAWMGNLNYVINNMDQPLPFVPKWEFKASGSYTIPKVELDFGLRFRSHTGRPVWRYESYTTAEAWSIPPNSILNAYGGGRIIFNEPTWLPSSAILDLRLEKMFRIKNYGSLGIIFDVLNVFNSADVTDIDLQWSWGHITGITGARTFRFSFVYQY